MAKATSPQVSLPAQRRMKARKTVFIAEDNDFYDHSETNTEIGSIHDDLSDDESFSPFAPGRKASFSSATIAKSRFRSPSLPTTALDIEDSDKMMLGSSSARARSSSTSAKSEMRPSRPFLSGSKFSDILDSVINEVESYLDNLSDNVNHE